MRDHFQEKEPIRGAGIFVFGPALGLAFWAIFIGGAVVFARFVGWM
ncbi:hypothetical protein [Celeribacter naphthalenivorans]|nr:hypothetical protein [Celeribacter naphthalenivorans]